MRWSKNLAYAIGLITTDGNLSKDGRHIELTSKDIEQIQNFMTALKLRCKIGTKIGGYNRLSVYYRVQFSNVQLYKFLVKIGLTPNKTKTITTLLIPDKYFADFLRGHLDGDGYTTSFWDSIYNNSFRFYTGFVSASKEHLEWLNYKIEYLYNIKGSIHTGSKVFKLEFAKKNSVILLNKMYYKKNSLFLKRKHSKIIKALGIIDRQAGMLKLVNRLP